MRKPSRTITVAMLLIAASFIGLMLADFMPPSVENLVVLVALGMLGIGGLALVVLLGVSIGLAAWKRNYGVECYFAGVLALALFVAMALGAGGQAGAALLLLALQLVIPLIFVKCVFRSGSALTAAVQGAMTAFVSLPVLVTICAVAVGIDGGFFFGDVGPGFRALENLGGLFAVLLMAVWPIPAVALFGAIGGLLGRELRKREPEEPANE